MMNHDDAREPLLLRFRKQAPQLRDLLGADAAGGHEQRRWHAGIQADQRHVSAHAHIRK